MKPGTALVPLQEKLSAQLKRVHATDPDFSAADIANTHLVLTAGGAGTQSMQKDYASNLKLLMWIAGLVLMIACANIANLLLGARNGTEGGDEPANSTGCDARADCAAAADREPAAGGHRRRGSACSFIRRGADDADAGVSWAIGICRLVPVLRWRWCYSR